MVSESKNEFDIEQTQKKGKIKRNEIFLLALTIVLLLFFGEIFFRLYYLHNGKYIAVDENEACLKEMKFDNLPTAKNDNFVNFTRQGYWQDDPVIGIIPKVNYTGLDVITTATINGQKKKVVFYSDNHHNSQSLTNFEEFSLEKPKNVSIRIALFGDSFTCGGEGPLLFNMGYVLKELIPNSEIMNFCVGGRGIETMYPRYVIEAKKYHPDVVIFNVYIDDLQRGSGCPVITPNLTIVDHHIVIGPKEYPTNEYFYNHYEPPRIESYLFKHILFVYNSFTDYDRKMEKGLRIFDVMLDELKQQTEEEKNAFFVTVIPSAQPLPAEDKYHKKLINLLKDKSVSFFDATTVFAAHRNEYKNQSFYFINEKRPLGHYSPIGNAVHAQGIKHLLEQSKIINKSADYHFANFGRIQSLYLIPEETMESNYLGEIRALRPFRIKEANFTDGFAHKINDVTELKKIISSNYKNSEGRI